MRPLLEGPEVERVPRHGAATSASLQLDGRPLHTALRYGLTQALLDAAGEGRSACSAAR